MIKPVSFAPLIVLYAIYILFMGFIGYHISHSLVSLFASSVLASLLIVTVLVDSKKGALALLILICLFFAFRIFKTGGAAVPVILFLSSALVLWIAKSATLTPSTK